MQVMNRLGFVLLLSALACVACSPDPRALPRRAGATQSGPAGSASDPLALKVDSTGGFSRKTDDFSSDRMSVTGDLLELVVSYGGGCESHDFAVWTTLVFSQSQPPVVNLFVVHDANNDLCEAYLQATLWIDLSPIRAAFLKLHPGTTSRAVSITVQNAGAPAVYKF